LVQVYNFLASWQLFPEKGIYGENRGQKAAFIRLKAESKNTHHIQKLGNI
jgi:hypothetical protein